ncbi:MAG: hypothetical protein ACE5L7_11815 [Candidatus Aminicenantales bacterium]
MMQTQESEKMDFSVLFHFVWMMMREYSEKNRFDSISFDLKNFGSLLIHFEEKGELDG